MDIKKQKEYYNNKWTSRSKKLCICEKCRVDAILRFISKLNLNNPEILDFGCGTGWLTYKLSGFGKATGIDLSDAAIKHAREIYPNIIFFDGDVLKKKINKRYNIVVSSEVIEHIAKNEQANYIEKIKSFLKLGGYLILTTPNKKIEKNIPHKKSELQPLENWLTISELRELISPSLKIISTKTTQFFPIITKNPVKQNIFRALRLIFYNWMGFRKIIDPLLANNERGKYIVLLAKNETRT